MKEYIYIGPAPYRYRNETCCMPNDVVRLGEFIRHPDLPTVVKMFRGCGSFIVDLYFFEGYFKPKERVWGK